MPYLVDIDPVLLDLPGPLAVHWYGIMYLLGFATFLLLGQYRARQNTNDWTPEQVSDLLFYGVLGVILGGRLGYVFFYDFQNVLADPHRIYRIWDGGMSFHGGLIGVMVVLLWFARKTNRSFFQVADFVAPLAPPGLLFGRIGNFIGGELWGRTTDAPVGVIFPSAVDMSGLPYESIQAAYQAGALNDQARHPSQLYEAGLEGLVLFIILWVYSRKPRPTMAVSGLFMVGYGVFRSIVEFYREPDDHIGFIAFDWLTMGHILSLPLILVGLGLMIAAYRNKHRHKEAMA